MGESAPRGHAIARAELNRDQRLAVPVASAKGRRTMSLLNRCHWLGATIGFATVAAVVGIVVVSAQASSARVSAMREFNEPSGIAIGGGRLWVTKEEGDSVTEINERCVDHQHLPIQGLPIQSA